MPMKEFPPVRYAASSDEAITMEKKYGAANYSPLPVCLGLGRGAHVWDLENKKYLDFLSGIGSVSQGHCHPKIISALVEQAQKLTMVSRVFYSDTFGPFAKFITEIFGYDRVLVMNTGVEAVETAIKLARKWGYTKKGIAENQAKILFCDGNFHGRTLGAISASTSPDSRGVFGPFMPGFPHVPYNDLKSLEQALKDPTLAAFVVEPIQGEGGVVVPDDGYLRSAFEMCRAANVLFIADEVQTGIARTGKMACLRSRGRSARYRHPRQSAFGGLLPVSAILADDPVMLCFQPGDHGSTFGGNPLACAVAIAALQVVGEEKLADNAERMGNLFRSELRSLPSPVVSVRGKGLLNAIVFAPDRGIKAGEICLRLKENGLLAKNPRDNIIRFAPPLMISESEMREAIAIIRKVLTSL